MLLKKAKKIVVLFFVFLAACSSSSNKPGEDKEELSLDYEILSTLPKKDISYQNSIKPILGSRCVVCHGCYDSPCQLKLSSIEGLLRGANKIPVYNPLRLRHASPSRLFIDANTTEEWRHKGFFSVLNEAKLNQQSNQAPSQKELTKKQAENNLRYSILYRMLNLKQLHPQPRIGKLKSNINLALDAKQQCSTIAEFDQFAYQHPSWGMPYGLPNLANEEYQLLVQWLAQGSPIEQNKPVENAIIQQIQRWEGFLNQPSNKHQLVSRYIYEHLFLAQLYFSKLDFYNNKIDNKNAPQTQLDFFRLVRSSTPPGITIKEIATTRPYDSPGDAPFYYRLKHKHSQTIVKNHNTYALSAKKLQRIKQLFIETNYDVKQLPSYDPKIASNPFKVYKDIPPVSRYKFLLDDSHYFIESFIKGPVCRGQISLNVIDDYFWVIFLNPEDKLTTLDPEFLNENSDYFQLPADKEDTFNIISIWTKYWKNQKKYINDKLIQFKQFEKIPLNEALTYIYQGEKDNNGANAALTIFRHLDSASVSYGLIGDGLKNAPETTLVFDYPIFERIYYLLVAGFDVYGNLGHQLNTRLYMEFLRMEAEDNFLAFLPISDRKKIRDSWYQGIRKNIEKYFKEPMQWLNIEIVTGYKTTSPQAELYQKLKQHFSASEKISLQKNQGYTPLTKLNKKLKTNQKIKNLMGKINTLKGDKIRLLPDVTFVRVKMKAPHNHQAFTIINNKAYKHISSMFDDEKKENQRDYQFDTLTVVDWLEGSYPNFFLDVNIDDLDQFSQKFRHISNDKDYEKFIALYGVRRTSTNFWELSDWFYQYKKQSHPIKSGYFDLNRYDNR